MSSDIPSPANTHQDSPAFAIGLCAGLLQRVVSDIQGLFVTKGKFRLPKFTNPAKERQFFQHQADLLAKLHHSTKEAWRCLPTISAKLIQARNLQPFEIQGVGYESATAALVNFAKDFLENAVEAAELDADYPGATLVGWRHSDLQEWPGDLFNPWPDKLIATHIPAICRHYADNKGSLPPPSILRAAVIQEWEIAKGLLSERRSKGLESTGPSLNSPGPLQTDERPKWNKDRRQLSFGDELCKQYKRPAPLQELILQSFEEQGWQRSIDDPLDPGKLKNTIRDLQDSLRESPIVIERDGTGKGLVWRKRESPDLP